MAKADAQFKALLAAVVDAHVSELGTISILLAAKRGALEELLTRYDRDRVHSPSGETLQKAATELREAKDEASANRVLEFLYSRELAARNFTAANFLGFAEVKLSKGDLNGALELLRRMNLMVGQPFELLNESGMLLWRSGHRKEAAEYFEQLVKVQPWEPEARMNLALVREAGASEFAAIAQNPVANYETRVRAAMEIRKAGGIENLKSGSAELDVIAGKSAITEAQASQPFFVKARMLAAESTSDAAARFRLLSAAVSISPAVPRYALFRASVALKRWHFANALQDGSNFDSGLTEAQRIELLRSLAEVKRQVGDSETAFKYLDQLLPLLAGEQQAQVEKEIATERARDAARAWNEAHRPVISESLVPDRIVMPRVAAVVGGNQ
jgi:tetratricopeptide (TPR) repeat protein